jgi:MoaA/NifB/PqqE/SkfB family radical SAM enzyme
LCNFCADNWKIRSQTNPTFEEIKNKILAASKADYDRLIITGGEPTISPFLFKTIDFAREAGFSHIFLCTNARLLSIESFFEKIQDKVDTYQISFFAADPETFDRMAGLKGAFKQVFTGMRRLAKTQKEVLVNAVITVDNYKQLDQLLISAIALDVNYIQFAFPNPCGFARENKVIVPYSKVVPKVLDLLDLFKYLGFKSVGFENFPVCVFKDWEKIKPFLSDFTHPDRNRDYYTNSKMHTEKCRGCRFERSCEGIYKAYYEIFGDGEIEAIK